jgi:hypothetical protein
MLHNTHTNRRPPVDHLPARTFCLDHALHCFTLDGFPQVDGFPPPDKLRTVYVEHDIQVCLCVCVPSVLACVMGLIGRLQANAVCWAP